MKKLLAVLLLAAVAVVPMGASLFRSEKTVTWEGSTDIEMLHQAQADLKDLQAGDKIVINLVSPGGPVITSLEIARLVRNTANRGVIVEIHGNTIIASGATFVFAAGSKGYRYMTKPTLFLVHPIQVGGGFGPPMCVDRKWAQENSASEQVREKAAGLTQEQKIILMLINEMEESYMASLGQTRANVQAWLVCGDERVGNAKLAVEMGFADKIED